MIARVAVDVGTGQAPRVATAVPMLMDVVDRAPDGVAEAGLARDGGPALAADLLARPALPGYR